MVTLEAVFTFETDRWVYSFWYTLFVSLPGILSNSKLFPVDISEMFQNLNLHHKITIPQNCFARSSYPPTEVVPDCASYPTDGSQQTVLNGPLSQPVECYHYRAFKQHQSDSIVLACYAVSWRILAGFWHACAFCVSSPESYIAVNEYATLESLVTRCQVWCFRAFDDLI